MRVVINLKSPSPYVKSETSRAHGKIANVIRFLRICVESKVLNDYSSYDFPLSLQALAHICSRGLHSQRLLLAVTQSHL